MRSFRILFIAVFIVVVVLVFKNWFVTPQIIGGDWPYYHHDSLQDMRLYPYLWSAIQGNGLGSINPVLALSTFQSLLVVLFVLWGGIPWEIVYKGGIFGLYIFLSIFSTYSLLRDFFQKLDRIYILLGCVVYLLNTYALMLVSGGQMGVALGYAISPLVFRAYFLPIRRVMKYPKAAMAWSIILRHSILAGLLLSVQVLFDPRIAYITCIAVGVLIIFSLVYSKHLVFSYYTTIPILVVFISIIVAVLMHAFWLFPFIVLRYKPLETLGSAYTSLASLKFFSFADFSHALGLLQPNWPENIFGKTYFFRPEFLVIPILAWISFALFIRTLSLEVLLAGIIGLLGIFLSKGINPPFGNLYAWLFTYIPGFTLFRDSTKFYTLIALSYMLLIPYSVDMMSKRIFVNKRTKKYFQIFFPFIVAIFLFGLIRPALFGKLNGTFSVHRLPPAYGELANLIQNDTNFSRLLWIPRQSRFAFITENHPSVEAESILFATNSAELAVVMSQPAIQETLSFYGIGYIIVPEDTMGELFLTDRKYDSSKRDEYKKIFDNISWLKQLSSNPVAIYKTQNHKDLFWFTNDAQLTWRKKNVSEYDISINISAPGWLYFSENYVPGWVIIRNGEKIISQRNIFGLNTFYFDEAESSNFTVTFEPQRYVDYGLIITLISIIAIGILYNYLVHIHRSDYNSIIDK